MTFEQFIGEDKSEGESGEEKSSGEDSGYGEETEYGDEEIGDLIPSSSEEDSYDDEEDDDEEGDSRSSDGSEEGEDRAYTGDMFGTNKPVKFTAAHSKMFGNVNKNLNVYEYVCFSIWRNSGSELRFSRLKDTVIPIAPVQSETRFRTSHSSKSVYYLGEEPIDDKGNTKIVLVVISL